MHTTVSAIECPNITTIGYGFSVKEDEYQHVKLKPGEKGSFVIQKGGNFLNNELVQPYLINKNIKPYKPNYPKGRP